VFAHLVLGGARRGGADALEDACVLSVDGLGPDVREAEVGQQGGGEDGCFEVGADADDGAGHLVHAELPQGDLVGGVATAVWVSWSV
jgi:hypothetical protein